MRRYAKPLPQRDPSARTGRPPALTPAEEWQLYCYKNSGVSTKTCASMFRVSVPTAKRIIAKFRRYDAQIEPLGREYRERVAALRNQSQESGPMR
jgi:hypothetical protein